MTTKNSIVLITGGNAGLGFEIVKALVKSSRPYEILVGSRDVQKGESAIKQIQEEVPEHQSKMTTVQVDVTSDESIEKAYDLVSSKLGGLDVLINNAGANFDNEIQGGKMTARQAFNASWDVNVSGAHVMALTFMPLLLKSSDPRLLFLTSGTSSLIETEKTEGMFARLNASPEPGWPKPKIFNPLTTYRTTKTGLNMLVREWHRTLKNDGVKVFAVSPGFLATGLAGNEKKRLREVSAISCLPDLFCKC